MACEFSHLIGMRCAATSDELRNIGVVTGASLILIGILLILLAFGFLAVPGKVPRLHRKRVAVLLWIGMVLLFAPIAFAPQMGGCGPVDDLTISNPSGF